ncbi:MAG: polyprenyl synthetase family protein [Bacteroidales bacterium]
MHTIPYLQEIVRQEIEKLEFPISPVELYEPIAYSMSIGGKRIRPLLVLLAADLYDGNIDLALPPALGLEIFHNFTLLHDDIMDNAPMRRGQLTVYRKWDINTAILAGDTMFTLAYDFISRTDPAILPAVFQVFNQTAREVCEGQQLDMNFETDNQVTLDDYLEMIRLKTAVLLGCCLKTGGLVAGAGQKDADLLYHFGQNLGIAFQIQDDLLDTFGDDETFGKKTGGDIAANKKTWLYLKALDLADSSTKGNLIQCYNDSQLDAESKFLRIKGIFSDLNIPFHAGNEIERHYSKATEFLYRLSLPEHKLGILKSFGDKIINRTY